MNTDTWAKRTVAIWPSLPFAALGFILAWNLLASTGAAWVSTPDIDSIYRKQQYVISTASFAFMLLVMVAFSGKLRPFLQKSRSAILGGAVASFGSLLIILAGPYFLGPFLANGANNILYYIGCVLAGAGNALVMLKCADLYGSIFPRNAIVRSAQSLITSVVIYFLATGFPDWRFMDNGPIVMGTGAFVSLPLLGGILASFAKYAPEVHLHGANAEESGTLPRPFWRLVLVASFLSFIASLISGYAAAIIPTEESSLYSSLIIILQIPVALAFIAFAVTYNPEKRSFGRVFTFILVIMALAIALAPMAGGYNSPYYQMLPFVSFIFVFCFRSMLFFIVFQRREPASIVFGLGYGFFTLADSIGWLIGSIYLPAVPTNFVVIASVVFAFLALAGSLIMFSTKDFDDLFESVEEDQASLSSLMERRLDSGVAVETNRGRFKVAIDIIADEYSLSRREKDVLRHLAMGHDSTRIAEELGVSWNTVRTHTRNLYGKLDVHSKQEVLVLVDSYR